MRKTSDAQVPCYGHGTEGPRDELEDTKCRDYAAPPSSAIATLRLRGVIASTKFSMTETSPAIAAIQSWPQESSPFFSD